MTLKLALSVVAAALAFTSAAAAQEEQWTISNDGSIIESFDLNASAGRFQHFISFQTYTFNIVNDTFGNGGVEVDHNYPNYYFPNGSYIISTTGSNSDNVKSYIITSSIFDSVATRTLVPGDIYSIGGGDTLSVSAVSEAPEPSTWALMILGTGMAGAMLRYGRHRQASTKEAN
jgi:hypothetical protein